MIVSDDITKRFWTKVRIGAADECWPFTGAICTDTGYGRFNTRYPETIGAHRYAYATENGDPGKATVRHACDNRPCCNPSHLLSGTHQDNMDDMVERGRHIGARTIYEADVVLIRERRAAGTASSVIASEYGFSEQHVNAICRGRFWPEAGGPLTTRVLISDDLLRSILERKGSMTQKECAELHGVSKPAVQQIWSGFRKPKGV